MHLAGEVLDLLERAMNDDAILADVSPEVWALFQDDPSSSAVRQLLDGLDREAVSRLIRSDE